MGTRDLRNRPRYVRNLAQHEDLVLRTNGKPIAILLGIREDELEETARAPSLKRRHNWRSLACVNRQRAEAAIACRPRLSMRKFAPLAPAASRHESCC